MRTLFFLLHILPTIYALFWKLPLGKRFSIQSKEIRKPIEYRLSVKQQNIINKFDGFYGLLGPDINITNVNTIFDLFTGDGIIQGIFFDKGELVFIKHLVRTDKLVYEMENGKIPNNLFMKLLFTIGNKVGVLPDILGLANTAFMNVGSRYFALYERDVPYEIAIDFHNKTVSTIKKCDLKEIEHFSAHTKVSDIIETVDYHVATNKVYYYQLDENLEIISKRDISTQHMPLIHDIICTSDKVILMDSPIIMDMPYLLSKPAPVILNKKGRTWIHVLNKNDNSLDRFSMKEGIYIFHYADYTETQDFINIYASQYEELDFSDLNIKGKYRRIQINKNTKEVSVIKNPEIENLDLEFPISYDDKVVLRSIKNKVSNGFIICQGLEIIKKLEYENRSFCGEPAIKMIEKVPYLISFAFDLLDKEKSYLVIINMHTYEVIEIPLLIPITIGFHSSFFSRQPKSVSPSYNAL
jgi:carotenoid cleavage dioxygenase-like enzyme